LPHFINPSTIFSNSCIECSVDCFIFCYLHFKSQPFLRVFLRQVSQTFQNFICNASNHFHSFSITNSIILSYHGYISHIKIGSWIPLCNLVQQQPETFWRTTVFTWDEAFLAVVFGYIVDAIINNTNKIYTAWNGV